MTLLLRDEMMKEEGRAEGRAEGILEGRSETRKTLIKNIMERNPQISLSEAEAQADEWLS